MFRGFIVFEIVCPDLNVKIIYRKEFHGKVKEHWINVVVKDSFRSQYVLTVETRWVIADNIQLLDEVEHNIVIYQWRED